MNPPISKKLSALLEKAGQDYAKHHIMKGNPKALKAEAPIGGSQDITINVPVRNGHGEQSSSATTCWVTITGYFVIQSPAEGTWHIVAKVDGQVIFDKTGVKKGDKMPFSHKCGWSTQLAVSADWSQGGNTTLVVNVHADY